MQPDDVRRALEGTGVEADEVRSIAGGWANWTFLVDQSLIVRFPRTSEVAVTTQRELRLLPALSQHLPFAVPRPRVAGTWAGHPFFGYDLIEGRALESTDRALAPVLGGVVSELHSFPIATAAELLGSPPAEAAWAVAYRALWPVIEELVLPELHRSAADRVRRGFGEMVDDPPDLPTCLIHNDLGPAHVLIGRDGSFSGLIDFEDACLGDPATDLMPLVACLGRDALPDLLAGRDLGERLDERMHFYRWMGSVHAILYGVREGVEEERVAGIRELSRRLPPI